MAAGFAGWTLRRLGFPIGAAVLGGAGLGAGTFCELVSLATGITYHVRGLGVPVALLGMAAVPGGVGAWCARRSPSAKDGSRAVAWLIAAVAAVCVLPAAMSDQFGGAPLAALIGGAWWLAVVVVLALAAVATHGPVIVGVMLSLPLCVGAVIGWMWDPLLATQEAKAVPLAWPVLIAVSAILGLVWLRSAVRTEDAGAPAARGRPRPVRVAVCVSTVLALIAAGALYLASMVPPTVQVIRRAAGDFSEIQRLSHRAAKDPEAWTAAVEEALVDREASVRRAATVFVEAGVPVSAQAITTACTSGPVEARSAAGRVAWRAAGLVKVKDVVRGVDERECRNLVHDMVANSRAAPLLASWSEVVGVGPVQPYWDELVRWTNDKKVLTSMIHRCVASSDVEVQRLGWRWSRDHRIPTTPELVEMSLASPDEDVVGAVVSRIRLDPWWESPRICSAVVSSVLAGRSSSFTLLFDALAAGRFTPEHMQELRLAWLTALASGGAGAPRSCLSLLRNLPKSVQAFAAQIDRTALLEALRRRTDQGWADEVFEDALSVFLAQGMVGLPEVEVLCLRHLDVRTYEDGSVATLAQRKQAWEDVVGVAAGLRERCPPSLWVLVLRRASAGQDAWYQLSRWQSSCPEIAAADPALLDALWDVVVQGRDDDAVEALAKSISRGGSDPARVEAGMMAVITRGKVDDEAGKRSARQLKFLAEAGILTAAQHPSLLAVALDGACPMDLRRYALLGLLASGMKPADLKRAGEGRWPAELDRLIKARR